MNINEILGYNFKNPLLLQEALSHPSICTKNKDAPIIKSYERLEFLGDSALNLVISELLIKQFPDEDEGKLAKRRAALVAGEILAKIALSVDLGSRIEMTMAEKKLGGLENPNNLEDALEAVIGAIYLDSEIETLKQIIQNIWQKYIDEMIEVPNDPKSKLQEILQQNGNPLPIYELIESSGPKHMLTFKIRLNIPGLPIAIGEGKSKQQAEKAAAIIMLNQIIEKK